MDLAAKLDGIPQTKKGNPIPGQFQYPKYHLQQHNYTIDLTYEVTVDYYESGESAWGDGCGGTSFPRKNWATYFTYSANPCE